VHLIEQDCIRNLGKQNKGNKPLTDCTQITTLSNRPL